MCYYKTDEFMQQSGRIDSQIGKNLRFESSVNSEGIETAMISLFDGLCLRAV